MKKSVTEGMTEDEFDIWMREQGAIPMTPEESAAAKPYFDAPCESPYRPKQGKDGEAK